MELERQVASVERGIAFLKQEHLAMLAGLQLEITHLRRRCHELSCELDSRFPDRSAAEEEVELAARCDAAERLLEQQQRATVAARGELRAGRARAMELGRSLREEERCFLEELKRRSHKITALSRELQHQNVLTATLHHELHAARLKLFCRRQGSRSATVREGGESLEEEDGDVEEGGSPGPSDSRAKKYLSVREERVRACVPQERVTSPQKPHAMPDPALFLVPLNYRLVRLSRAARQQDGEAGEDEWEDIEDGRVHRRVDMGAAEGETAL